MFLTKNVCFMVYKSMRAQPRQYVAQLLQTHGCICMSGLFFNLLGEDMLTENYILCYSVYSKN